MYKDNELQILRKRARFYDVAKEQYIERYRQMLRKEFMSSITAEQYLSVLFVANTIRDFLISVFLVAQSDLDRIYDEELEKSGYLNWHKGEQDYD